MLKKIAESIKHINDTITSALRLALLVSVLGGGWWAYRKAADFISSFTLPAIEVKLPSLSGMIPGPTPEGVMSNMDWSKVPLAEGFGDALGDTADVLKASDIIAGKAQLQPDDSDYVVYAVNHHRDEAAGWPVGRLLTPHELRMQVRRLREVMGK